MVTSKSPDPSWLKNPFTNLLSFCRKTKKPDEDSPPWARFYPSFTFEELSIATNNFKSIIGRGGVSSVYEAVIHGGFKEKTVVIKMYDKDSLQSHQCFLREIELPSSKRDHPNILSPIGYCIQGFHWCILFEYMPNRTLHHQLHSQFDSNTLSWKKRLQICTGVARGIDCLYSGNPLIIHRDIKTSNIFLDNNWSAKVSDFHMSILVPKTSLSEPDTHVSTVVAGTVGYLDPEYLWTGRLTVKSDVYSFGVVLFEVLSARKPWATLEEQGITGIKWWRQCVEDDRLGEIIDPRLKDKVAPDCLKAYVDIAYKCSNERGSERPTMADVVKRLELILLFMECIEADVPFSPSWLRSIAYPPKKSEGLTSFVPPQNKTEPSFGIEFHDSDISVSDYDSDELLRD